MVGCRSRDAGGAAVDSLDRLLQCTTTHSSAYLTKVFPESPPWYDLYRFVPGDPEINRTYIKQGFIAWWSAPDMRVRLLRPLSSVLFTMERHLFGDRALFYHLHSLAWFAGLLAALWALYRRWFTREVAALALLVFGLSSANLHLYGWVSARHVLLSVTFVVLSLLFQERALEVPEEKSSAWQGLSWLMLLLALASGESGLCGLGSYAATRAFFLRLATPRPGGPYAPPCLTLYCCLGLSRAVRGPRWRSHEQWHVSLAAVLACGVCPGGAPFGCWR